MTNLIETLAKIEENCYDLIAIRVDGEFYHVDHVEMTDEGEFEFLLTYQLSDEEMYVPYTFYPEDLEDKTVILYKLQTI